MRKRRHRHRHNKKVQRVGFIVAAMILIPALIIARLTVTGNAHIFWPCIILCFWAEYRMGWMK